ncbi:MAG: hypothetical protein H7258_08350 [Ferruginibacter sp.]|nr:hypothetical protein [Ferruginibacter sp.]
MNTKIYVCTIVLIFMLPHCFSIGASYPEHFTTFENRQSHKVPSPRNESGDRTLDWTINFSNAAALADHNDPGHENKSHDLNYERFYKNRRRFLFILIIKLVLTIAHLGTLLCTCIHFLH